MGYNGTDNLKIMECAKNYNEFLVNLVLKRLKIKKRNFKKILDFGCADGFFMEKIFKKDPSLNLSGVDSDNEAILSCKLKGFNCFLELKEIDEKEKFDFIYSFNALEHILDDVQVLSDLNKKLNEKGELLLYLPAFNFLFSSMDRKIGHYRRYDKKDIIKKLKTAGFKNVKAEYCDFIGVFATLAYILKDKFFKNNNGNIKEAQIKFYDCIFPLSLFFDNFLKLFLGKNIIVIASKS